MACCWVYVLSILSSIGLDIKAILVLVVALGLILYCIWAALSACAKHASDRVILNKFDLASEHYYIIGTDLGGRDNKIFLRFLPIIGAPDAVFRGKSNKRVIVGEFKGRKFRGIVRLYEYYQIMLYLGMARKTYKKEVAGKLAFTDKVLDIEFDPATFEALVNLARKYENGYVPDQPLHKMVGLQLPKYVKAA